MAAGVDGARPGIVMSGQRDLAKKVDTQGYDWVERQGKELAAS